MKILAPISHPSEAAMLLDAGATELYAAISPEAWMRRFSHAVWLSRRAPSAAISDLSALAETVVAARDRGAGLHLALNAPRFTAEQLPLVVDLAEQSVRRLGVEAIIAADLGLMSELGRRGVPFVASTVAVAHNAEAFSLFADLGAVRAVLPRHLTLLEIERIARAVPEMVLEAFVLFDNCAYEEGLCRTQHDVAETGAFCQTPWQSEPARADGRALDAEERARWSRNLAAYQEWLRWADACGHPLTDEKLPNGACGLCAIHGLRSAGVRVLKLAGREAGPYRKLRGVQMVARVVSEIDRGSPALVQLSRQLRATPELCDSGAMCYYPACR